MAPRQPSLRRAPKRHVNANSLIERNQRAALRATEADALYGVKSRPRQRHRQGEVRQKIKTSHAAPKRRSATKLKAKSTVAVLQTHDASHKSSIKTNGIIPPWTSLPYEILLEVFRYAAGPLLDETHRPTPSLNWLLQTSRLCRSFCEPALAILYESPPLCRLDKPHRLLDLLRDEPTKHFIDYRTKIKRLDLDSVQVLCYKTTGRGWFELSELFSLLPRLAGIDIVNDRNRPPFRRISQKGNWYYPQSLFSSLQDAGIRLNSWRWHGDMLSDRIPKPGEIHASAAFNSLRHLTLSNLRLLPQSDSSSRKTRAVIMAKSLAPLVQLSALEFESCTSDSWDILEHLPATVSSLRVINCPDFGTDHLGIFLRRNGKDLKNLKLNHNQSLNLTFLSGLSLSCPRLEQLEVDLTYFSASILGDITHQSDSAPRYEALLNVDDVPTWPANLQQVTLLHLRKLSSDTAKILFGSLIAAASDLPFLRSLVIKAILDISWRERAGFREEWIQKLRGAFLRRPQEPDRDLSSKLMFDESKQKSEDCVLYRNRGLSAIEDHHEGGPCETVEISIDNMRPSELRYTENDFMDSEESGDEEWQEQYTQNDIVG